MPSLRPLLVALALGLAACVPADRFEEARQRAFCSYWVECGDYPDVDLCLAINFPGGADPYLASAVEAGRIAYHSGPASRCIDAIEDLRCTYREDVDAIVEKACEGVFEGTVPPEGECLDTRECARGSVCGFDPACLAADACCPGHCRFLGVDAEIGEACDDRECVDGAICDFGEDPPTCIAPPSIGEECTEFGECAPGTYCDDMMTCVTLKGEGGACQYDSQCAAPGFCWPDADGDLSHCRHPAGDGEACDFDHQGRACLSNDHFCDPIGGRCNRRREPGESCLGGDACLDYARCINGTCTEYRGPGETCSFSAEIGCYSGLFCDDERCEVADAGPPEMVCTLD